MNTDKERLDFWNANSLLEIGYSAKMGGDGAGWYWQLGTENGTNRRSGIKNVRDALDSAIAQLKKTKENQMSTQINDGGPAFPHFKFAENGKVEICPQGGMTLRDYFAGQALAGMMAHDQTSSWQDYEVAGDCYVYADAMIKAREVSK